MQDGICASASYIGSSDLDLGDITRENSGFLEGGGESGTDIFNKAKRKPGGGVRVGGGGSESGGLCLNTHTPICLHTSNIELTNCA